MPDRSALWYSAAPGNYETIFRAPRLDGDFGNAVAVLGADLNIAPGDGAPVVTPDELTLFFSSARLGGVGSFDVWMAKRATATDSFGEPVNVQAVNSTDIDTPSWVSADGCVLYLTKSSISNSQLYVATRNP